MNLTPLFEIEMHYTWMDYVGYTVGGQYVATCEGAVSGERVTGTLKAVNIATKRPDNVNCPAFRGVITTDDGAKIYFELNGVAVMRLEDKARIFTTSLSLRTGDARYDWVNNVSGAAEGILNTTTDRMTVRTFACENELATVAV